MVEQEDMVEREAQGQPGTALLAVRDLVTRFRTSRGSVHAVSGISFSVGRGEIVGLVGESGSGKSVTARSIMGLIPDPPGTVSGSIRFDGEELIGKPQSYLRRVRGEQIAMVFQDPMTSLDPLYTVGDQVAEALCFHRRISAKEARPIVIDLFGRVGIPEPVRRVSSYPHQLSGGMRQRVMIAMAIACGPRLLIADEPTTALDVTIQAQILTLIKTLNREQQMAVLLVTHDLGVIAQTVQRVMVMYAGRVVEEAPVGLLFARPLHPYTIGLLASIPDIEDRRERLNPIPGSPPDVSQQIAGCAFAARCSIANDRCRTERPELRSILPLHRSACHVADELLLTPPRTLPAAPPKDRPVSPSTTDPASPTSTGR